MNLRGKLLKFFILVSRWVVFFSLFSKKLFGKCSIKSFFQFRSIWWNNRSVIVVCCNIFLNRSGFLSYRWRLDYDGFFSLILLLSFNFLIFLSLILSIFSLFLKTLMLDFSFSFFLKLFFLLKISYILINDSLFFLSFFPLLLFNSSFLLS